MLQGEYIHCVGYSASLEAEPEFIFREIVRPFSMYEIINPKTWHSVQPTSVCFTVMCNGSPWEQQHTETRTTKGKDLEKMSSVELESHLATFSKLLTEYQKRRG